MGVAAVGNVKDSEHWDRGRPHALKGMTHREREGF
jgi:hypothetical protein